MPRPAAPRRFTLQEARDLLPEIQDRTSAAVRAHETITERVKKARTAPEQVAHKRALQEVVRRWIDDITRLGAEAKGLWLVDFDNGAGYYCWEHPEPALDYFHTYEDGRAGRLRIN
jgi:hypothetical protein